MNNTQNQNKPNLQKDEVQRKSSGIFIQLGFVFALLMAYLAIESKTYDNKVTVDYFPDTSSPLDEFPPETNQDEPQKQDYKQPEILVLDQFDIKEDDVPIDEPVINTDVLDPTKNTRLLITNIPEQIVPEDLKPEDEVSLILVDEAPVFPGCKGNNDELKKCFSQKVTEYINQNFDTEIAQTLGLEGVQRINVTFKVDANGQIKSVFARGTHKSLENEAIRVVNKLPKMKPGKMNGKAVRVNYSLPIKFEIN